MKKSSKVNKAKQRQAIAAAPQVPSGEQKKDSRRFVITTVIAVLAIVTVWGTTGPLYDTYFGSQPRLVGRISYTSFGRSVGEALPAYAGSVVMLVHLESRHETPVEPVNYGLELVFPDGIVSGRPVDIEADFPITFQGADALAAIGKSGTWTACIPRKRSLLAPGHVHSPITRDKPVDGVIRFLTPTSPEQMKSANFRLHVLGADGTDNVINEKETQLGLGVFRRFEPDVRWVSGVGCGDPKKPDN